MKNKIKETTNLPKITFGIVTFNEEKRIRACLEAILMQDYPNNKMEIIIMDGGSTDQTIEIVKKFKTKIYFNDKILAEPGLAKAYKKAKGDYMVFMAADNILFDKDWTKKMVQPFIEDRDHILASFCQVVHPPHDNIWNNYINEDADPFSMFTFGNASHPDKFRKLYTIKKETNDYVVFNYTTKNFPLIALAQCLMLKTGLTRRKETNYDDILPLIDIIKNGGSLAYVKTTGIYHHSLTGFSDFKRKLKRRIYNSIITRSYASRDNYVSKIRKIRRFLFLLYSLSIFLPLIDGIRMSLKKRKPFVLIHPIASLVITYYIFYNFVKIGIKLWQK